MKGYRCAVVVAMFGGGLGLLACQVDPNDSSAGEQAGTTSSALNAHGSETADVHASETGDAPPSSADLPSLTLRWSLENGVHEQDSSSRANLRLESHDDEPLEGHVTLEITGLGTRRKVDLGSYVVAPHSATTVAWEPGSSPIAPVGTIARVVARVTYTRADLTVTQPSQLLSLAFSADSRRAYLSLDDGMGVRRASLGAASSPASLLAATARRRGHVDGHSVDDSLAAFAATKSTAARTAEGAPPSDADEVIGDTLSFAGAFPDDVGLSGGGESGKRASVQNIGLPGIDLPPLCLAKTVRVCSTWQASFSDTSIGSLSVVSEDHTLANPAAAYAEARVNEPSGYLVWSGRLGHDGCTPELRLCSTLENVLSVTTSLQTPEVRVGGTILTPASREVKIYPLKTFASPVLFASTPTGPLGIADIRANNAADQAIINVGAVTSRILTMPDNGVPSLPAPVLALHTENGCVSSPGQCAHGLSYGPPGSGLCGEACARADDAWFGPNLKVVNGQYVPTGAHTTESAYTIGHELGHTVQWSAQANGPSSYANPGTGMCGCSHVASGNQLHCLQSSHDQPTANVEGFGHFYATRVMNDQTAAARFTYYKTTRNVTYTANGSGGYNMNVVNVAPPVPISAGTPFTSPTTTGWVRNFCSATNRSSEYDWLTFLWGINGAPGSRSTMKDILAIFNASTSNFTWPTVHAAASARFGPNTSTFIRFRDSGNVNGVNL
jgi:hypothetical protein